MAAAAGTPAVLVGNQKGGVGKSSIVANVAVAVARRGRRVVVFDVDQQGNLTTEDLGVPPTQWDKGRHLASVMQYGADLKPFKDIRPNLDIVMGGPSLGLVSTSADRAADAGIDIADNFRRALNDLCEREKYDLVLVDSGHGDVTLLLALLEVCSHLVVPAREDSGSMRGVEQLATSYLRARRRGSAITLLGVVLFQVNPRATARNEFISNRVRDLLEGSSAEPFTATIRHASGPALETRERHLTAQELVQASKESQTALLAALREGRSEDIPRLRSSDPVSLANDYQNLTREILQRVFAQLPQT
ncbi:ParA family protein [Mycobacterium sp. 050128]|uniref:ParA family protein n=1 Tax=Mycobacterium sp. 050128 TaxID=3096112 RepID=UPI002EDB570D